MRLSTLKALKRNKSIGAIAVVIVTLLIVGFFVSDKGQAVVTAALRRQLPIYCVQKNDNVVSLSFDAAWGNEDTDELIGILGKYNVKATFFVVGEWVDKYPESVKALAEAGHEIMNHSDNHAHYTKLTAEKIVEDINKCNDKIEGITGKRPILFRPPYGDYNDNVISTVNGMGMYPIQWDVDSLDWKDISAKEIRKRVTERVKPGSIVLFHNAAKHTPEALPEIIEDLIQKGYTFLPVSQLIYTTNYSIDHTGKQIPNY